MDNSVQIDALKARWMTGGTGAGLEPDAWRGLDDLSLLALAGQYARVATRPSVQDPPRPRDDIPALLLPTLPKDLRPQFRRALESKQTPDVDVVRMIAARGYCVNPIDWMPKRNAENLPPVYEAWRDWLEGNLPSETSETLSAETWDMVAPSRRYTMLTTLHRDEPEAARALIAEMAPKIPADQRVRMLQCLRPALTQDDAELLQGFEGDRSSKVQTLVKTQLARLGTGLQSDAEALAEIADYVDVAKAGILSRQRVVTPRKLKTNAQKQRRSQVFAKVSLAGLADVLKMPADEVIESWDFRDGTDDFIALVGASGTDDQVRRLSERSIEANNLTPEPLMARLDKDARLALGLQVIKRDELSLVYTKRWIVEPEGNVPWDALSSIPFDDLISGLSERKNSAVEDNASYALTVLGLIADGDAAKRILEMMITGGLLAVDPHLTLLRLNAAL